MRSKKKKQPEEVKIIQKKMKKALRTKDHKDVKQVATGISRLKKRSKYWYLFFAALITGAITYAVAKKYATPDLVDTIKEYFNKFGRNTEKVAILGLDNTTSTSTRRIVADKEFAKGNKFANEALANLRAGKSKATVLNTLISQLVKLHLTPKASSAILHRVSSRNGPLPKQAKAVYNAMGVPHE